MPLLLQLILAVVIGNIITVAIGTAIVLFFALPLSAEAPPAAPRVS